VQLGGSGALLAAFFKRKPHTRSRPVQRTGNPGLALVEMQLQRTLIVASFLHKAKEQ
jgi:hypothetical protein